MEDDEPTEKALGTLREELESLLVAKYQVSHLELLDDALTSHLIAEREEPDEQR